MNENTTQRSVVLIDDSSFILNKLDDYFTHHLGFRVLARGKDGEDAVRLYREMQPDLITLDLILPNKSGIDALREILTLFPQARIIVISAIRGNAMLQCIQLGARGYVEKPLVFHSNEFCTDFRETVEEAFAVE